MATVRKIKVLSTLGTSGTIETNVTTLGQLKPLLADREINYSGMKMMVGATRNELNLDEAVLPEGDFKLYLMPAKTKSGADASYTANQISDAFSSLASLFETFANDLEESDSSAARAVKEDPDMADLRRVASGQSSVVEDIDYDEEMDDDDSW